MGNYVANPDPKPGEVWRENYSRRLVTVKDVAGKVVVLAFCDKPLNVFTKSMRVFKTRFTCREDGSQ